MEPSISRLAEYFANASLQFLDIMFIRVPAGRIVLNAHTMPDCCGLLFPLEGEAFFTVEGVTYHLVPGTIFHGPSLLQFDKKAGSAQEWHYALLHYRVAEVEKRALSLARQHFIIKVRPNAHLLQMLKGIYRLHITPSTSSALQIKAALYCLLAEVISSSESSPMQSDSMVEHAMFFLQQHCAEQISIEELAHAYGLTRKQFSNCFKKITGLNPNQYLIEYRLHLARELLEQNQYTVAEIAAQVGYSDSFYFSRIFKKYTGLSPRDFKRCSSDKTLR